MLGDTFEMEDQRQWNDASFKTYVRSLELPWPYTVPKNTPLEQAIKLTVKSDDKTVAANDKVPCRIAVHTDKTNTTTMPRIGLGLEPQHLKNTEAKLDLIKRLGVQQLVVWYELEHHGVDDLSRAVNIGKALQADLVLHAVIPDIDYEAEISTLASQCSEAGLAPIAVCVSPSVYLKSLMPGPGWPEVTPLEDIYKV